MPPSTNSHGIEMHAWQWTLADRLYVDPPTAANGVLTLTDAVGLGIEPRVAVLRETRVRDNGV